MQHKITKNLKIAKINRIRNKKHFSYTHINKGICNIFKICLAALCVCGEEVKSTNFYMFDDVFPTEFSRFIKLEDPFNLKNKVSRSFAYTIPFQYIRIHRFSNVISTLRIPDAVN